MFPLLSVLDRKIKFIQFETDNTRIRQPDINFNALLGIKIIADVPFLLVAEQAEPCCNIGTATVF